MPDSLKKVILLQPTGNNSGALPEMTKIPDTSGLYKTVLRNIDRSFISHFLDVYFLAQIYLRNTGITESIEPAYLALTQNQGGYAKTGFSILKDQIRTNYPNSHYVDIVTQYATSDPGKLMSFTQLYPHEMGHVIFHMLSEEDTTGNNTRSTDMHFFSVVTDYSTAFNEGFAEHIENVSRLAEKNDSIRAGIFTDINRLSRTFPKVIRGFKHDFQYPFRVGFYKASMIAWFQDFEDYRRYEYAMNRKIRNKNASVRLSYTEDQISFRNSGVMTDTNQSRNLVQMLSTEGVISSFFTHLFISSLSEHYMNPEFYLPFSYDSAVAGIDPRVVFTPLQNQYIKYIYVLHHFVTINNSERSQMTDFIEGYLQTFPGEADTVLQIFRNVFGTEYTRDLPPPLWLLVKDYDHRILIYDVYDAVTIPLYTFDLNAAEPEDLQTITGVSRKDAETIVDFRNSRGFFTEMDQIKQIPGISPEISQAILSSVFDPVYFENTLSDYDMHFDIFTLIREILTWTSQNQRGKKINFTGWN